MNGLLQTGDYCRCDFCAVPFRSSSLTDTLTWDAVFISINPLNMALPQIEVGFLTEKVKVLRTGRYAVTSEIRKTRNSLAGVGGVMKKVQQVSHRQYSDDIALVGHGNVSDFMFRHK